MRRLLDSLCVGIGSGAGRAAEVLGLLASVGAGETGHGSGCEDDAVAWEEIELRTCASMFSGGGLADWGMRAAGLTPLWGIEISPEIAEVYRANVGHVLVQDVSGVDWSALEETMP